MRQNLSPGTHWLLICKKNEHLLFADPLGRSLSSYKNIYQRLAKNNVQFYSFTNYLKTNQFKVKTQNCVDSFVFLLLI